MPNGILDAGDKQKFKRQVIEIKIFYIYIGPIITEQIFTKDLETNHKNI